MKIHFMPNILIKFFFFFLFLIISVYPSKAYEKEQCDEIINLFLDQSYLAFSEGKINVIGDPNSPVNLLFEAQIAPNFFITQNHIWNNSNLSDKKILYENIFSVILTPRIVLRMLNEDSSPVIPPSFIPKLTFQFLNRQYLEKENKIYSSLIWGTNLIVGHYSNGQTGCFFSNQTGIDPNCTPIQSSPPLNEDSGSFSTNFLRGELHINYIINPVWNPQSGWIVGGGAFLESNSSAGPGGISDDQRSIYGDGHYGLDASLKKVTQGNSAELKGNISIPYGETPKQLPTTSIGATFTPKALGGFGLFARYIWGQDYYNILFFERIHLFMIGFTFDQTSGILEPKSSEEPKNYFLRVNK